MTAHAIAVDVSIPADEKCELSLLKTFSFDSYAEEELLIFIGQPIDAKHLLPNIELQHGDQLPRLLQFSGRSCAEG